MQVDTHRERLTALGLDSSNYRALLMMPAVYVAWARGRVFDHARQRAFEIGKEAFALNDAAMRIVDGWLVRRPPDNTFVLGFDALIHLIRAVDEPMFDNDMARLSLTHAESLARANEPVPVVRDAPWAVSPAEREALHRAAEALGVDHGESWADVVEAVASTQPSSPEPLSGEDHDVEPETLRTRFDSSRQDQPPEETEKQPPMRHLKTAVRNKNTDRDLNTPPQLRGGKTWW